MRATTTILTTLLAMACADGGPGEPDAPGDATAPALVGAGWSFGECVGRCRGELGIDGDSVRYSVGGFAGEASFENRGTLAPAGLVAVAERARALAASDLVETYGCPDCTDQGARTLVLAHDGLERRVTYEYGRPPRELLPAHDLVKGLMHALTTCEANEHVDPDARCRPAPH